MKGEEKIVIATHNRGDLYTSCSLKELVRVLKLWRLVDLAESEGERGERERVRH